MLIVTSKTSDDEIRNEAARIAYASGIKLLAGVVEQNLKLERRVAQLEEGARS